MTYYEYLLDCAMSCRQRGENRKYEEYRKLINSLTVEEAGKREW